MFAEFSAELAQTRNWSSNSNPRFAREAPTQPAEIQCHALLSALDRRGEPRRRGGGETAAARRRGGSREWALAIQQRTSHLRWVPEMNAEGFDGRAVAHDHQSIIIERSQFGVGRGSDGERALRTGQTNRLLRAIGICASPAILILPLMSSSIGFWVPVCRPQNASDSQEISHSGLARLGSALPGVTYTR